MKANRVTGKYDRTPGERAFDRCFLPLAAFFVLEVIAASAAAKLRPPHKPQTEAQLAAAMPPSSAWQVWIAFAIGILLAVLWVRAFASLVSAWQDPSSRVRFSALVLLIPFAMTAYQLLLTPFQ
jgi:hypothetical protein